MSQGQPDPRHLFWEVQRTEPDHSDPQYPFCGPYDGNVYLARASDGLYKIGHSSQVATRLRQLEKRFGVTLELVHAVEVRDVERAEQFLHDRFMSKWAHHEFFRLDDADVEWICSLRKPAEENSPLPPGITDLISNLVKLHVSCVRAFSAVAGDGDAGLMLAVAWLAHLEAADPDGWFRMSTEKWEAATGLSPQRQRAARKLMKARGVMEEKLRGIPAKSNFRLNPDKLLVLFALVPEYIAADTWRAAVARVVEVQTGEGGRVTASRLAAGGETGGNS